MMNSNSRPTESVNPFSFLPVSFDVANDPAWFDDAHIVAYHPLIFGLTDGLLSDWTYSVRSEITLTPADALIISTCTYLEWPHIVVVNYGYGRIVVTATSPESHIGIGVQGAEILLRNELRWAAKII